MSETAREYRFVVKMPENQTNSGGKRSRGYWSLYREKLAYWTHLDGVMLYHHVKNKGATIIAMFPGEIVPPVPETPWQRVRIRSTMRLGGAMDDDNAMARHKPLIDWLKKRKYLADDRKKNITWEGFPEQIVKRDGKYLIELTVTPV